MRRRKVVRVLVAHKVQRHLRQRAFEVPLEWSAVTAPQIGHHRVARSPAGNEKHREGVESPLYFAIYLIAASAC